MSCTTKKLQRAETTCFEAPTNRPRLVLQMSPGDGMSVAKTILLSTTLSLATLSAQGEERAPGLGPIQLGMSYGQVRAATPNVEWTPPPVMREGATVVRDFHDYEISELSGKKALTIGGETLDVSYEDAGWDRYVLRATSVASGETSEKDCRLRLARFIAAAEKTTGALSATAPYPDYFGNQETWSVGDKSQAMLRTYPARSDADAGFGVEAVRQQGDISIEIKGGSGRAQRPGSPRHCGMSVELKRWPVRPPTAAIAFDNLVVTHAIGIGALHHSLDGTPLPHTPGVQFDFDCTIGNRGDLSCKEPPDMTGVARPFVSAARFRVGDLRVARRARDGRWTPGEQTRLSLTFAPNDRRAVATVIDTAKQQLLRPIDKLSSAVRYPTRPLDAEAEGTVTATCVVQEDGSHICPQIKVEPTQFEAEFRAAAMPYLTGIRVAPTLTNGEPSLGVGRTIKAGFTLR